MKFLSDKQLAERYGVHRVTPWRWIETRNFPRPVKLTPGCTRWNLAAVERWEAEQAGGEK